MDVVAARARWALLLSLAVLCGCAATRPRPDQPVVRDLEIEGTDQLSERQIKGRILTTETPWWEPLWPFDEPHYFEPTAWQADLRRIERYYEAEGYYQAQVVREEVNPVPPNGVELKVAVREGEPTRIASIEISGLDELPPEHRQYVLADLPLVEGEIFREAEWEGLKELLQERLRELGYAEAEVTGEARVDVATQEARVQVTAKPGQRYRFGNIYVATDANPKVSPKRIIEQAQGAIRKGDWFSETALAEAQARVFQMGVFGAAKVNRSAPDREAGTVPVVVDVREAPFHSIRVGGGVGLDAARNEVRVLSEYTNRNFLGGLRRFTVVGRAGWAFLPTVYAVSRNQEGSVNGPIFDAVTEFEQPRFLHRDLRLQTSLTLERGVQQAYNFIGGRLKGGVIWRPHPSFSVYPSYNLELYRLTGDAVVGGSSPALTFGCPERTDDSRPCRLALSYLEQVVEWDRRDDRAEPRSGYYASLSLQQAGGPLFGTFTYLRLLPDVRFYRSFGDRQRLTLSMKVRVGTLIPFASESDPPGAYPASPIVSRFYSGGSLMRGFNTRRLSPQLAIPARGGDPDAPVPAEARAETVPIGGNSLLETQLELRYRLWGDLIVAGFYDTGLVGVRDLRFLGDPGGITARDLHHAVGFGIRYLTVVGPIRLDVARRLNVSRPLPVQNPDGLRFEDIGGCFGIGSGDDASYAGAPEGLCTFHLSIGEAF